MQKLVSSVILHKLHSVISYIIFCPAIIAIAISNKIKILHRDAQRLLYDHSYHNFCMCKFILIE